jgi:hypothetical protein
MADGEKVGAVYVSVGVDTEGANEALSALEERINALEGRVVKIKVDSEGGANRGPASDPTSPPAPRHVTGSPPPRDGGGAGSSVHQARVEANVSGLRAKIEQTLKAPFQITLEIANLAQIREQIESLGGDVSVNVAAQAGGGGGGTTGGGGSTTSSAQTPIPTSFNTALAKAVTKDSGLDAHVKTLAGILDSVGKSLSMPVNPSGQASDADNKRYIAQALQRLGVAGKGGQEAADIIRNQLEATGRLGKADIDTHLMSLGYRPKGAIVENAEGKQTRTRTPRYGGVLRAAQYAPASAAAPEAPTSVVISKPEVPPPAPAPVEKTPQQQRREFDKERENEKARARLRIEREERERRGAIGTVPANRPLPEAKPRGYPGNSRGARTEPGVRIRDSYDPERPEGTFYRAEQYQIPIEDPQDVAMREKGIAGPARVARMETGYRLTERGLAAVIAAGQEGGQSVEYEGVPPVQRGPQGGSRNAESVGPYSISNPAPKGSGQAGNEKQYARTGGNIAGLRGGAFENIVGRLEAAIEEGDADAPGAVLKGGKRTGDLVTIPTITQSTVDDPSGLGDQYGTSLIPSGTGMLNVEGYGETEVERLTLNEWVMMKLRAIDPNAPDNPDVQRAVHELTTGDGHLAAAMENRRARVDPRTIMPPGKKPAPGAPRASNNRLMGGGASSLNREAEGARSYGYLGYEGQFIDAENMTAEDRVVFESLGYQPITIAGAHGMTYAEAQEAAQGVFPGKRVAPIYRHGPPLKGEDEPTWELAGFAPTGVQRGSDEMRQEERRRQEAETAFARENRLRVLRSSHPQAFKSTGEPDPEKIDEYGMLIDPTSLTADDAHRVTAAEDQFYGMFSGGIKNNPIWALTQRWGEQIKTGTYDRGAISGGATEEVGRFQVGTPFSQGVTRDADGNWTHQDPRRGAFEFELQQELNKEGGLWDQLNLAGDERPMSMKGIISKLQNLGPAGRQILGPAVTSVLQQIDNTEYFGGQGVTGRIQGRETQAARERVKNATAKGKAARASRTRGVTTDAAGRKRRSLDDVGSVPEFVYNPYSGPMAALREELEGPAYERDEKGGTRSGPARNPATGSVIPEDQIGGIRGQATPAAEELAAYEEKLEGRRRERARKKALRSRGLDPRLTDEQLAQGKKRTRVKPGGDTITYRKGGVSPITGKPTMRLHVGRETEDYYEPYEGYDAEAIAAEVESGGYINTGEKTRLAALQAEAQAERQRIDAQVAEREARLARMEEVREHAYAKADRLMGKHGKGYTPSEEELRTSVMNDPRIPQGMHGEVADTMQQQMERGGGSMVMAFGERGKIPIIGAHGKVMGYKESPTATTRRRAEETEHDMGLRKRVEGDIIYDKRTKGRRLPSADETSGAYGERAGVITPGERDAIRIRRERASDTSGVEKNAAQRAIESIEGGRIRISRGAAAAGGGAPDQTLAGMAAASGAAVPVYVTNWPSGGFGGGGGGGKPPTAESGDTSDSGDEKEPSLADQARAKLAAEKKRQADQKAIEEAAKLELEEMYGAGPPGGDVYSEEEMARAKQREDNEARKQKQRERAEAQATRQALGRKAKLPYAKEIGSVSGLEQRVSDRLREEQLGLGPDELGQQSLVPGPMTIEQEALRTIAGADVRMEEAMTKVAQKAEDDAKKRANAASNQNAGANTDKTSEEMKAIANRREVREKRIEDANRKREKVEGSLRRPTSRRETEARMVAQGLPTDNLPGGPFGFMPEALTPEAYSLTASAPMMQEVRGAVRTARGRNPQRALGTTMIQLAQNTIGNADDVNEQLARVEQMNAVLGQMGREYGRLQGDTTERQRTIEGIAESRAMTSAERDVAFGQYKAARKAGDDAGAAEARLTFSELTKQIEEDTLAIEGHEKQIETNTQSMEVLQGHMEEYGKETIALAKDAGKASNVLRNLGAGFVGGIAGGLVTMGVSTITQGILAAVTQYGIPALDEVTGSGLVAQRRQRGLADVYQQSGFRDSAITGQYVQAGLGPQAIARMEETVSPNARAIAQAQQLQEQFEFLQTEQAVRRQMRDSGTNLPPALGQYSGGISFMGMNAFGSDSPIAMLSRMLNEAGEGEYGEDRRYNTAPNVIVQQGMRLYERLLAENNGDQDAAREALYQQWGRNKSRGINQEVIARVEFGEGAQPMSEFIDTVLNDALEDAGSRYRFEEGRDTALEDQLKDLPGQWGDLAKAMEKQNTKIVDQETGQNITIDDFQDFIEDLAGRMSFTAATNQFLDSSGWNNQLWRTEQRFALQDEQLRLSQGMSVLAQRPLQFGTGIAYRQGGPGMNQADNIEATALDDAITAGINQVKTDLVETWGVSQDLVDEFALLGEKTQAWATEMGEIQADQQLRGFNISLAKANMQMDDLRGLMGKAGGSEIGNLQRANVLLQRRQQLLQFEMQQRKINFSVAMAGFQSIGLTGEERAANIRIAKKEAAFQQESLDINREMFGNNIQIFDKTNMRNFQMLARDINHMVTSFDENTRLSELAQKMSKASTRSQQLGQQIGQMLNQEMALVDMQNDVIQKMADETDQKLVVTERMKEVTSNIRKSINKLDQAIKDADRILQEQREQQRSDDFDEMNGVDEEEGDRAGIAASGSKGPVIVNVTVQGHAVPVDQIAGIIERKLGEQGELRGLNQ